MKLPSPGYGALASSGDSHDTLSSQREEVRLLQFFSTSTLICHAQSSTNATDDETDTGDLRYPTPCMVTSCLPYTLSLTFSIQWTIWILTRILKEYDIPHYLDYY